MTRPALTHKQSQVYAFVVKFLQMNDSLPSCSTIASAFGYGSNNAAQSHMEYLEQKGYLQRNEEGALMLADRAAVASGVCPWSYDDEGDGVWRSACGELWSFIDGGPADNRVTYCHHCGGRVHLVAQPETTA
jgi:hypothetical protein